VGTFDLIAAAIVIVSFVYVTFVLTLADWFSALRRGEAVALLPKRRGRRWPVWTQAAMVLVALAACVPLFYLGWVPLAAMPPSVESVLAVLGLLLYLGGLALTLWARRTLGENWGISTSLEVKLRKEHQLVQTGPYAQVRHPMYLGWWIAMVGLTLLYPVWAVFLMLVFSLISFSLRARREEAALAERFGPAWAAYKSRTKFLIPFLY